MKEHEHPQSLTPEEVRHALELKAENIHADYDVIVEELQNRAATLTAELKPAKSLRDLLNPELMRQKAEKTTQLQAELNETKHTLGLAQRYLDIYDSSITVFDEFIQSVDQLNSPESLRNETIYNQRLELYNDQLERVLVHPVLRQFFPEEEEQKQEQPEQEQPEQEQPHSEVVQPDEKRKTSRERTQDDVNRLAALLLNSSQDSPVSSDSLYKELFGEGPVNPFTFGNRLRQLKKYLLDKKGYDVVNLDNRGKKGRYYLVSLETEAEREQEESDNNLPRIDAYGYEYKLSGRSVIFTFEEKELFRKIYFGPDTGVSLSALQENKRLQSNLSKTQQTLTEKVIHLFGKNIIQTRIEDENVFINFSKQFRLVTHKEYFHLDENRLQILLGVANGTMSRDDIINALGPVRGEKKSYRKHQPSQALRAVGNAYTMLYNRIKKHLASESELFVNNKLQQFMQTNNLDSEKLFAYFRQLIISGVTQEKTEQPSASMENPFHRKEIIPFIFALRRYSQEISSVIHWEIPEHAIERLLEEANGEQFVHTSDAREISNAVVENRKQAVRKITEFIIAPDFYQKFVALVDNEKTSSIAELLVSFYDAANIEIIDTTTGHRRIIDGFTFISRMVIDPDNTRRDISKYYIEDKGKTQTAEVIKVSEDAGVVSEPEQEPELEPTVELDVTEQVDEPEDDSDERAQQKLEDKLQKLGQKLGISAVKQLIETSIVDVQSHPLFTSTAITQRTFNKAFPSLTADYVRYFVEKKVIKPVGFDNDLPRYSRGQIALLVFISRTSTKGQNLDAREYKFIRKYIKEIMNPV